MEYCKTHDPLKNASNGWTKDKIIEFKCDKCSYFITPNKKYKQCKVCKISQPLNYLEECYGLNYKNILKKRKKTHRRMNNKYKN